MTNTKTQCRETQPWYDSRGLEMWNAGLCLEVHRHGMVRVGMQGGLENPSYAQLNHSPLQKYRPGAKQNNF